VRKVIDGARWVNVAGVFLPDELPDLPPLKVWRPEVFGPIDALLPICPGHLSVWTGLAGDGKSTLVNAVMWTLAERYGLRIAAAPFEATPQREYFQDLVAYLTQRAVGDVHNPAGPEDEEYARAFWRKHIVFLNPDGYDEKGDLINATIEWFLDAADTAVQRYGCRVIVLDPWSQIDHEPGGFEREDQYVRRVLKGCKRFARERDVHVAIVAHPAKPKRNPDGTYPIPEGYDISGAAHWKNAPDLGVTVYRDPPLIEDPENPGEMIPDPKSTRVLVKAWKVKSHRMMNPTGEVYASFNKRTGRYSSAEHWEDRTFPKKYPQPQGEERE
jgi:twinkle protein